MGLKEVIENGVATIKSVTTDLQATITHKPCTGFDASMNRNYGASATYNVIIVHKQKMVRAENGKEQLSKSQIIFLESVTLTMEDEITLPDGSQPQLMSIDGVAKPDGSMYAPTVYF